MNTIAQLQPLFVVTGIFFIAAGLPLVMNLVKPNNLYGFRLKRTLSDERVWYIVNSYAGKLLILTGTITIIAAVALRYIPVSEIEYQIICTVVMLVCLVSAAVASWIYMNRIP